MTVHDIHEHMRKQADSWVEEEQRKKLLFDVQRRRTLRNVEVAHFIFHVGVPVAILVSALVLLVEVVVGR